MRVTLSHLWAVQTLQQLDVSHPLSSIQILRVASILCPDLTQQHVWSEMTYTDLIARLQAATEQVVASLNAQDSESDGHWSVWPNREIDAA